MNFNMRRLLKAMWKSMRAILIASAGFVSIIVLCFGVMWLASKLSVIQFICAIAVITFVAATIMNYLDNKNE